MKTLIALLVLIFPMSASALATGERFTDYDEKARTAFFIKYNGQVILAEASFGMAEGVGDCVRVVVESKEEIAASENAHILSTFSYNVMSDDPEGDYDLVDATCESKLVKKLRVDGKTILYFAVGEEYLKHWVGCQSTIVYAQQPMMVIDSMVLTDEDVIVHNAVPIIVDGTPMPRGDMRQLWDKDTGDKLFGGERYQTVAGGLDVFGEYGYGDKSKPYSGPGFDDHYRMVNKKCCYNNSPSVALFHTDYKDYGFGIKMLLPMPENFVVDATIRQVLTVEMNNGEQRKVEARIMTNDKGAIYESETKMAYRHVFYDQEDTIYRYTQYYTSELQMKNMYKAYEKVGLLFAKYHPELSYWKNGLERYDTWREKRLERYFYDYVEDNLADSCVANVETTLYLNIRQEDFETFKSVTQILQIDMQQDGGYRMTYGTMPEVE